MMRKQLLAAAVVTGLLAITASASADEVGTYTLPVTTITGRVPRPSVVVEMSRAKAEVKLADLYSPNVEKILRAGTKDPF